LTLGDTIFACTGDGTIHCVHARTGVTIKQLAGHRGAVTDMCLFEVSSPALGFSTSLSTANAVVSDVGVEKWARAGPHCAQTKLLASSSYDGSIMLWHPTQLRLVATLSGHRGPVWTLASVPGLMFSGSADGCVRVWRALPVACADSAPLHATDALHFECVQSYTLWPTTVPRQVMCLRVVGPLLLLGSSAGEVLCWDMAARNGALRWCAQVASDRIPVRRLCIVDNHLIACLASGRLLQLCAAPVCELRGSDVRSRAASADACSLPGTPLVTHVPTPSLETLPPFLLDAGSRVARPIVLSNGERGRSSAPRSLDGLTAPVAAATAVAAPAGIASRSSSPDDEFEAWYRRQPVRMGAGPSARSWTAST
ncbi:hypothetical protein EON62_00870, partial [archaeon]